MNEDNLYSNKKLLNLVEDKYDQKFWHYLEITLC